MLRREGGKHAGIYGDIAFYQTDGQYDDRIQHTEDGTSGLELLYTCLSNLVKELHWDGRIEMLEGLEHYADPNDRNRVVYHDREIPQAERLQKVIDDATELLPKCADEYADSSRCAGSYRRGHPTEG